MAMLHPDQVAPGSPASESRFFNLSRALPDEWTVIHSVAWQSPEVGDGEADFVLIHPRHGVIVLEVKGGGIEIQRGQYVSIDSDGNSHVIRNPFEQARRSKHVLVQYLRATNDDLPFIPASHGVVFVDVADPPMLGPEAPPEIVIDRHDLRELDAALVRVAAQSNHRGNLSEASIREIVELLAPTENIQPLLRDDIADANARLLRLTDEQFRLLGQLQRNRQAIVYGGAGTGKTLLAVERAKRLAQDGFRVLLTCFNRGLGNHLKEVVREVREVEVRRFIELCRWQSGVARLPWPDEPDEEWFDETAPNVLIDAVQLTGFEVDAVVVDEGQDFAPAWWDALRMLMADPDDGPFYVFADHHQAIYRKGDVWEPPFQGFAFDLVTNCRNTLPIANRVAGVFADDVHTIGAPGTEPEFIEIASFTDAVREARRVLVRLLHDELLDPSQVVVLTSSVALAGELRSRQIANHYLVGLGEDGLVVDTFHSFKGLEADVVVAVLPDFANEDLRDQHRALSYIGLSRAKAHLIVLGTNSAAEEIAWMDQRGGGGS